MSASAPAGARRAAIAIDAWKLPIFERHLRQAGYAFHNAGLLTADTLVLRVNTINLAALGGVVKAANTEAALTGKVEDRHGNDEPSH